MAYLNYDNLEVSVDFGTGFYENLGVKTFSYSFIELFDDEVNYSLSSTVIQALPILDVNIKYDGKTLLQNTGYIKPLSQPLTFTNKAKTSTTENFNDKNTGR